MVKRTIYQAVIHGGYGDFVQLFFEEKPDPQMIMDAFEEYAKGDPEEDNTPAASTRAENFRNKIRTGQVQIGERTVFSSSKAYQHDFPETYLNDGVYASFDGYQIWLRTSAQTPVNEIALEPQTLEALNKYIESLKRK